MLYVIVMDRHDRNFIEAAFMSALSVDDLVLTLGCCRSTVYNYARRYGLSLPPSRPRGGRRVSRGWGLRGISR